jgi:predicted methyltransferase
VLTLLFGATMGWAGGRLLQPAVTVVNEVPVRVIPASTPQLAAGNGDADPAIEGGGSLFFNGFSQVYTSSAEAKAAGEAMLRTLRTKDPQGCAEARETWARILPLENFGGEYGTLDWLCRYVVADEPGRAALVAADRDGARVVRYFDGAGWNLLERYLTARYQLLPAEAVGVEQAVPGAPGGVKFAGAPHEGLLPPLPPTGSAAQASAPAATTTEKYLSRDDLLFLHELLRFNGPNRHEWERSDEVVASLGLKPGMVVADLGAGHGYMSIRFADAVGPTGKVYALELGTTYLDHLQWVQETEGLPQLLPTVSGKTGMGLPDDSVDLVWICNLYHEFYGSMREGERAALLDSIRTALRPGGRLVIADNLPEAELPAGQLYYHGFAISPKLVIPQIEAVGFQLKERRSVIPQRYLLEFVEK